MKAKPLDGGIGRTALVVALLCVALASTAFAGLFSTNVVPGSTEATASDIELNFTVNNTDPSYNITSVNITLPSGFVFIEDSNKTSANPSLNDFSNGTDYILWDNTTSEGFILISGSEWFNATFSATTSPGNYTFNISVWHTNGELNYSEQNITIQDTTPPSAITLISPENGTWTNQASVYINLSFTELNPSYCLYDNATSNTTNTTTASPCQVYVAGYAEGNWTYTLWVNDTSGNLAQNGTYTLSYDTTPPVASSLGLFYQGGNVSGSNITELGDIVISVNVTDALSGINTTLNESVYANITSSSGGFMYIVNLTQASGDIFNGTWDAGQYSAGGDNYSVNITATDSAGNIAVSVISSGLEIVGAPDLFLEFSGWTSDNPSPGHPHSGNNLTLNVTVYNDGEENFTGDVNVTLSMSGAGEIARSLVSNDSLDYGESVVIEFPVTSINFSAGNGLYTFTVTADPDNAVQESSESNNTATLGLSIGYNISLVKINNGTTDYLPPDTAQTFTSTNITVNISVTYTNGTAVTGLDQNGFQFFNMWSGSGLNMSDRIYSFTSIGGGYYTLVYDTPGPYEEQDGNKTRPRFGDNYINITAVSGSYSGHSDMLYNVTAPDLSVYIDIDDVDLQGDTNGYWINFNLSITNNGNAPAYNIKVDDPNDWVYDGSVFDDLDPDGDLTLGVLMPGENHNFPDGTNKLRIDAIGTSSGSDRVLWVFVHYNDSDDNAYQGFDYDKTDIDDSGAGGDEDTGGDTGGTDTGGDLTLEVTLTDWDDVIQGYPGESNTTMVKVKNTGDVTVVAKVRFTCEVMDGTPTIAPISKSIAVNSDQEFIIDFAIKDDAEIGEYDCEAEAYVSSSEDDYDKETIVVDILPTEEMAADIEGVFENISLEVEELLDRFSKVNPSLVNETNMTRVQNLIDHANDTINEISEAIEGGDYLTAHSLIESLQASLISTTQALEDLELEQNMVGGVALSGTWFWAIIIIVVVIAVAFVAYLMFPQKSYGPKKSMFGTLTDTVKGGTTRAGSLKDTGKSRISGLVASKKPFRPSSYAGSLSKNPGYSYGQGPGAKIKGAFSKLKEKLKRKKRPQKEVTQYFVNSSSNIINYS